MTNFESRVGVVRHPTALGPEAPTSASTLGLDERRGARLVKRRERARKLERRGRPGPLATATIQAPRGLEASLVKGLTA